VNENHEVPGDRKTRGRKERYEDEGPSRISTHRSKGSVAREDQDSHPMCAAPAAEDSSLENAAQSPSEMDEGPRWIQSPRALPPARRGVQQEPAEEW
jgi:hypothetical protein